MTATVGGVGVQQAVETLLRAADDGSLAQLCERHDVEILTLFGSARTDPASARDVDLAVRFRGRATPDPVPLIGDLMDLLSTDAVDVLLVDRATPTGRFAALVEGLPLYETADGVWANAQMAAAVEFYETEWLRRLDLEQLAR